MYVHRMTDVLFHMLSNIVCLRGLADLRQSDKLILKKINQQFHVQLIWWG